MCLYTEVECELKNDFKTYMEGRTHSFFLIVKLFWIFKIKIQILGFVFFLSPQRAKIIYNGLPSLPSVFTAALLSICPHNFLPFSLDLLSLVLLHVL